MFLPYFDYIKNQFTQLQIDLLITKDYEQQLFDKTRTDLIRIQSNNDLNEDIFKQYDYLCQINFREWTPAEAFNKNKFLTYKADLCAKEELGLTEELKPQCISLQQPLTKYIGFSFVRYGNAGFNPLYNIPYEIAKFMWYKTKELGYIPIEIMFINQDSYYTANSSSKKYDFVDRTTRDLPVNFETVLSIFNTLRGYVTMDNGLFHVAANYFNHKNILFFDLVVHLEYISKYNDFTRFDLKYGEKFTEAKFVNWLKNTNGEKLK